MACGLDGRDRRYIAPSRMCGEHLGLPELWCDWGLRDHELLQAAVGGFRDGFNEPLVDWVVRQAQHFDVASTFVASVAANDLGTRCLRDYARYHFALGVISQFTLSDIAYFLKYETVDRPEEDDRRYSVLKMRMPPYTMQWVPSPVTMSVIESALVAA